MATGLASDYGLRPGELPSGPRNLITDVAGVSVGHVTLDTQEHKTGVTVVLPCRENPYLHKLPAGVCVLNGFGKSLGLMQLEELGYLESPIALTNTLNVGLVHDGLVEYLIGRCRADGEALASVNPIVCECNDATLNHIQHRAVTQAHVLQAIQGAGTEFAQGDVGAGKGTICHGLKGGIGSASRMVELGGIPYTIGILIQTNHGLLSDLTLEGRAIGRELTQVVEPRPADRGSVIALLATDLPLDSRQLARLARRVSVGLARLGSFIGHGSGEVFLAFSTANPLDPRQSNPVRPGLLFSDEAMDLPFRAAAQCAQEAVLNSMLSAQPVTGYLGHTVRSLSEFLSRT